MMAVINLLQGTRENRLLYLVHYGSKDIQGDIDLLGVYKYEPNYYEYAIGRLDLFAVSFNELNNLLKNHDPTATEPLLTGELIQGDFHCWNEIKKDFLKSIPDSESIYFLYARAFESARAASTFIERYGQTKSPVDHNTFWKNVSFAISYLLFANLYAKGQFPLTFEQVRKGCSKLDNAVNNLRVAKRSEKLTGTKAMEEALTDIKKELAQQYSASKGMEEF